MLDRLGQRAGASGDDRGPGRERLDGHETERLRPGAEHHRRERARVERIALEGSPLAEELDDPLVDRGLYDLVEVSLLVLVVDLGRHLEGQPRPSGELDYVGDPLLRGDPANEGEIVAGLRPEGHLLEREAVV